MVTWVVGLKQSVGNPVPHIEHIYRGVASLPVNRKKAVAPWVAIRKSVVEEFITQPRCDGPISDLKTKKGERRSELKQKYESKCKSGEPSEPKHEYLKVRRGKSIQS